MAVLYQNLCYSEGCYNQYNEVNMYIEQFKAIHINNNMSM